MSGEAPQREAVTGLPQIQEEEAREALLGFIAENCCYGKGAAQELKFTDLRHSSAFHVSTFEPGHEKICLQGFRPGLTKTGLYSHRRWLEA